ncbi:hypothetical protein AUJ14_00820 [Candidatus Micrarchaeota archaeon CG1_02_55_22]|nr:MAG: hypothetical protein AUJ14_00820 [Candidatus Micrarchaeota archaeon CG1_02_55_22]
MGQYDVPNTLGPKTIKELEEKTRFITGKRKISEFVTAITGRKEIPLKFEYLGEGADRYEKVLDDEDYSDAFNEAETIRSLSNNIIKATWRTKANLVYVGCGNGMKVLPLLHEFGKTHNPLNYALLDISPSMLLKAYKNTRQNYKSQIIIRCFEWDFEEGNFAYVTDYLKKNGDPLNLILFLGNTIGNLSDRARILANFRESMSFNDYLLITFHMVPRHPEEAIRVYSSSAITSWLTTALDNIGIDSTAGTIKVSYDKKRRQVEFHFNLTRDVSGSLDDREVNLHKGQKVLLATSHKFSRSEIRSLLNVAGFKIKWFHLNKGSTMANVLCQPKQL